MRKRKKKGTNPSTILGNARHEEDVDAEKKRGNASFSALRYVCRKGDRKRTDGHRFARGAETGMRLALGEEDLGLCK